MSVDTVHELYARPKRPPLLRARSDSDSSFSRRPIEKNIVSTSEFKESSSRIITPTRPNGQDAPLVSPNRPARNPARAAPDLEGPIAIKSPIPIQPTRRKLTSKRPRTATGTREEVTPWELYPPPPSYGKEEPVVVAGTSRLDRSRSVTNGHPASSRIVPPSTSARPPSSSGTNTGISFPDIGLLRRKSTGSKLQKNVTRTTAGASVLHKPRTSVPTVPTVPEHQNALDRPRHSPRLPHATPRVSQKKPSKEFLEPLPEPYSIPRPQQIIPSVSAPSNASVLHKTPSSTSDQLKNDLKFSTADRTILEELKRNIQARSSQFVVKGGRPGLNTAEMGVASSFNMGKVGGVGGGKRHHSYPKEEVPYPRSYERQVVDLDTWENLFCNQLCGSLTWHQFDEPPTKVLDIGCGTGSWILDCSRTWRNCHFVGLDVVPLHPDLMQVGSLDLAQRITWVQHNFLDGLPFSNEEFDFVHIKRISRGVPEDKWDFLFEEITRVMKPGAAFEMIEEDLFFPGQGDIDGGNVTDDEAEDSRHPLKRSRTTANAKTAQRHSGVSFPSGQWDVSDFDNDNDQDSESSVFTSSAGSSSRHRLSDELSPTSATSTNSGIVLSSAAPGKPSTKTILGEVDAIVEDEEGELRARSGLPTSPEEQEYKRPSFHTGSTIKAETTDTRRRVRRATSPETSFYGGPTGPGVSNSLALQIPSKAAPTPFLLRSPASVAFSMAFLDLKTSTQPQLVAPVPRHHSSHPFQLASPSERLSRSPLESNNHAHARPRIGSPVSASSASTPVAPFVLRQLPRPPINPRDHSLLQKIHNEMHSSRFINLSPLSILPNLLGIYFKDVRTHPPLQLTFPPKTTPPGLDSTSHDPHYSLDSLEDLDTEARTSTSPPPAPKFAQTRARSHSSAAATQQRSLSIPSNQNVDGLPTSGGDESNFISVQNLIMGTSPYVSLDGLRLSALSPRASILRSPKQQKFQLSPSDSENDTSTSSHPMSPGGPHPFSPSPIPASILSRNNLPNKTLKVDLRSLNLHLWARVAEIIACSETMWEWILEYQEKAKTKPARTGRARSKSIDVAQPSLYPSSKVETRDTLEDQLVSLTREDYDNLLLRYYMDMQDHMDIESAIEKRFNWSIFQPSFTAERKSFDDACKRYVLWKQEQRQRKLERSATTKPLRTRPLSTSYAPNTFLLNSFASMSQEAFNIDSHDANHPTSALPSPLGSSTPTLAETQRRGSASSFFAPKSPVKPSTSAPRRLSRSLRVFVAWKSDSD